MNNITRSDLVKKISESIGLSESICDSIVIQVFDSIFDIAINKGKIHIKNFGSFNISEKTERPGRDISKNIEVKIGKKKVLRFSSSRNLRFLVNQDN